MTAGDWPRISETQQVLNDGAKYIGPDLSALDTKDTVEEARKIFLFAVLHAQIPAGDWQGPSVPQLLHQAVLCPMLRAREPKGIQRGRAGGA